MKFVTVIAFESLLEEKKLACRDRLLMVGLDGPNVNKKLLRLIYEKLDDCPKRNLVDLGTCKHSYSSQFVS